MKDFKANNVVWGVRLVKMLFKWERILRHAASYWNNEVPVNDFSREDQGEGSIEPES